jgi:tetratricopeptide (TPR) repeat protein
MKNAFVSGLIALTSLSIGCAKQASTSRPADTPVSCVLPRQPTEVFREGLERMAQHDRENDWNAAACKESIEVFERIAAEITPADARTVPRYNAALVHQRCGNHAEARKIFRAVLDADPAFYPARASLALDEAKEPNRLDHAIVELRRAVVDSHFQSVAAHVALATLQMQRGNGVADDEGPDDFARAKKSLHRALAVNDAYMPALNQLAILYLTQAKREGGGGTEGRKATMARLELAALVCSQAIRKNPRYAPIHNTLGLVDVELGNLSRAAAEFDEARKLDPRFIEAHLNYAAVNLGFRGFAQAEEAYRKVLAIRPADYDARLGLALAIRGQIQPATAPEQVAAAAKEIAEAKRIAPARSEAYFNEAILVQSYGPSSGAPGEPLASYGRARALYEEFLAKSNDAPELADARKRAKERLQDLDEMIRFAGNP